MENWICLNCEGKRERGVCAFERVSKASTITRSPEREIAHDKSRLLEAPLMHGRVLMPD